MSKEREQFYLQVPLEHAQLVCKAAIAASGWTIFQWQQDRIVVRLGVGPTSNPVKLEVLTLPVSVQQTLIVVNARIYGIGPIQRRHLKNRMSQLRGAIESTADAALSPANDPAAPVEPAGC